MFERFTDRARKVMALANQEAQRFNHEYIGTEHILLGLVKEGSGVGANVLKNLNVDLRKVRLEVEKLVHSGPDMVTMGKPMGNGFPLSGVAMRPELVQDFGTRARYFNTFGGNPVAAAAGMAVLDVIREENLQENSLSTGAFIKNGLEAIARNHPAIAQVRGAGLFLAVECVSNTATNAPDASLATFVVNYLRRNGVLISASGPGANILKIRPPLVMREAEAQILLDTLDDAFAAHHTSTGASLVTIGPLRHGRGAQSSEVG